MTRATTQPEGKDGCPRAPDVEAARDGRLSGHARDSFARHLEACIECRAQAAFMEGLGRGLRDLEVPEGDDVSLRRLRHKVLVDAEAHLARGSLLPRRPERARVMILALACLAPVVALVGWRWTRAPHAGAAASTSVKAVDEGGGGARWTRHSDDRFVERIELSEGILRLEVQRPVGGKRVMVRVPDGEIEDLGTVFSVSVAHGRTQRVRVDEGRVTLRLAGGAPRTVSAGDTWERPADQARSRPASGPRPAPPPGPKASVATPAPPPLAAQEDAAYLRTLRLLRAGHGDLAKTSAKDYLRRFPGGFRREEIGRIAR